MKLEVALAPEVTPRQFFEQHLPDLFEARRELFAKASTTSVIVSVHLSDVDERYTVEFSAEGCRVERGEMIDFPVLTLVGTRGDWDVVKRQALRIAKPLEERAHAHRPPQKLTREFLDALERHDGEFVFELSGEEIDQPVEIAIILNDYALPAGAPKLRIGASFELGERLARAEIRPSQLDGEVSVRGDMGLGIDVGGLLLEHFPHLER
jgi:hypothetical protein